MKYNKNQKIRLFEQLLTSEYWDLYKQEIEKQVKLMQPTIHTEIKDSDRIYRDGIIAGMNWCLDIPERVKKDSENFINRLVKSLGGDNGS